MCGIVGYIGPRQAAPILLEGLARLEYRGYDSAGIALVTTGGEMFVEKRAGALAHLVEEAYAGDLADAVRSALRQAHGAYAVAVMHAAEPTRLVGARMNVPLIVGIGEGENFLASDVAAVLAHTSKVIFLEEGDVADIDANGVVVTGIDGSPRERLVT